MNLGPGSPLRVVALRVAVLGGLVTAAVGLRARGPWDADRQRWDLSDVVRGSSAGLLVLLLLWALAVAVVMVLSRGGESVRLVRPQRRNPLLVGLLLLALFLLARLFAVSQHRSARSRPPELPAPSGRGTGGSAAHQFGVVGLVVVTALVLVAVLVAFVRASRPPVAGGPELTSTEESAVADGLSEAARVLREHPDAEPRTRVLLAYLAFEDALARRGIRRGAAGTPSALLERAVVAGAPAAPAQQLTRLFGVARFSAEPVTQGDVTAAERALDELLAHR